MNAARILRVVFYLLGVPLLFAGYSELAWRWAKPTKSWTIHPRCSPFYRNRFSA